LKKLIIIILLSAAFLGGYYLGNKPGAPDIFKHARENYQQAANTSEKLTAIINNSDGNLASVPAPKNMTVNIGGKNYVLENQSLGNSARIE